MLEMSETNKIKIDKIWKETLERERVILVGGNVEIWLEMICKNQSHVREYYDVAKSQLAIHHLTLAKKLVNEIIESIKHGHFKTNVRSNLINKLIEHGSIQKKEYTSLQNLFKQNGGIMSECEKIIYYLDEITAKTGNKIKTILEYYNSLKINLIIMKGKLTFS